MTVHALNKHAAHKVSELLDKTTDRHLNKPNGQTLTKDDALAIDMLSRSLATLLHDEEEIARLQR